MPGFHDFMIAAALDEAFHHTKQKLKTQESQEIHQMDATSKEFVSCCPLVRAATVDESMQANEDDVKPRRCGVCQRQNSDRKIICRALKNYRVMQSFRRFSF